MSYEYRSLPVGLHSTANAAMAWFIKKWGIKKKSIVAEGIIDPNVRLRPTFVARTNDFHTLCIEVSESIYSNTLDSAVLDCFNEGLPVKMVVAVPRGITDPQFSNKLRSAKQAGIGILEVDHTSGNLIHPPLSLSLAGVRVIRPADFPPKYRENLDHARDVFRNGEPAKACSLIYDEMENVTRRLAKKCYTARLWPNRGNLNLDKAPWASILLDLNHRLDRSDPRSKPVNPILLARVIGITAHRNDAGHKPKNAKDLIKRDQQLRTRFENSIDVTREFLEATKAFRL